MPKGKPMKVGVYVILDAKRQAPANFEIPGGLPPLQSVGDYVELPVGAPKGAFIHSIAYTGSPVEDIYTVHFVATASVSYAGDTPTLVFELEAEALFELIALGVTARSAGKELTDSILKQVGEVVANESQAGALAWIAEQRRQVARSR